MNFKSLLGAAALITAAATAQAFPSYSVYPAPGSTLQEVSYFDSFNITPAGGASISVTEGAKATLFCEETGETYTSTDFKAFMESVVMIKFDSSKIKDNGLYTFTIAAGQFKFGGESNEKITITYTLNDPTLGQGEFPQITLVSSDPADGAKLPYIGGENDKITFKTSNDDAVNYIEYYIYDVTDPNNPEYVYQSNSNRYDLNRYGDNEDHWKDGLFVNIGGEPQNLIKDHKYEVKLTFCGIGYDPSTGQYPNQQQIQMSKELETSIYWYGLTEPTQYSPYQVIKVSPDPDVYEIDDPELAIFDVEFSGPVKPTQFMYSVAQNNTADAGTYTAMNDEDGDGYATMWEFKFAGDVVNSRTGTLHSTFQAKDANGLNVKGNGGYVFDDYNWSMTWKCNCGADVITSVSPLDGQEVDAISEIIISNHAPNNLTGDPKVMALSYNTAEYPRIVTLTGEEIVPNLGEPVAANTAQTRMKWTLENPITTPGVYVLIIPKYYFAIGEEMEGSISNLTTFKYIVKDQEPSDVAVDLNPLAVTPTPGTDSAGLENITLVFKAGTYAAQGEYNNWTFAQASLYRSTLSGDELIEKIEPTDMSTDFWNPDTYSYVISNPITEKGDYKLVIPEGTFCDEAYFEAATTGHINPELTYTWTVGGGSGVSSIIAEGEIVNVYNVQGMEILKDADAAAVKALPAGLYIINGKKVFLTK
ncbi:MAG: hypothetical protein NC204_04590 [Candidatus Amulumruptor caecigallinarius]|nr:hypothetical protein [Candidatus Amulumruptor caecigallinarius]